MRLTVRFLLLLLPILAIVAFVFNALMDNLEHDWALRDIRHRGQLVYDSIQDPILETLQTGDFKALLRIYKRIFKDPNLEGVIVCSNTNKIISRSGKMPKGVGCDWTGGENPTQVQATIDSGFYVVKDEKRSLQFHRGIFLVIDDDGKVLGNVLIFQDVAYSSERSELARQYTIYLFLGLGILIALITILVHRWSLSRPIEQLGDVMKGVVTGDKQRIAAALEKSDLAPLVKNLDEILVDYRSAKGGGSEIDSKVWNPVKLNHEVQTLFGDSRICVIASEEPYVHNRKGAQIETNVPASGVVHAIEPIIRACSGVWIADGLGTADHETADKHGRLLVPPEKPEYALKRVWLSRDEEQGFSYGFSNEGLWPLSHLCHERPIFRQEDWQQYVGVNAKFASAFTDEMKASRPLVMIQDYHFALLPQMIQKMRPDALISFFWHIPWPTPETIRICPWRKELIEGMIGADLLAFQGPTSCHNFLNTVERYCEARVSREESRVSFHDHDCFVKPAPISVQWPSPYAHRAEKIPDLRTKLLEELSVAENAILGVSIDRLDYTKGIIDRLKSVELFLEKNKKFVGKFVFVQLIAPNKMHIKKYQDLASEIQQMVDRINWKFYSSAYQPVILKLQHHGHDEVFRHYQAADFCFVSSLHDGMNLVAKEFISARTDNLGVLILSAFAGAARECKDALIVNPYDIEDCAQAILNAVKMSLDERKERMTRLRKHLEDHNIYGWGHDMLKQLYKISQQKYGIGDA